MPQYLSTDPNAGLRGGAPPQRYLSTDPNAGLSPQQQVTDLRLRQGKMEAAPSFMDRAVDALPMLGGMAGSVIGGIAGSAAGGIGAAPGAIGGAAGGGALGEWGKQRINTVRGKAGTPATISGRLRRIVDQGALQGGMQGIGLGTANLASRGARFAMNSALRPGLRLIDDAGKPLTGPGETLSARFPSVDIIGEAIERKVPIRNSGLTRTQANLGRSRQTAMDAVDNARATAPLVPVDEALAPARARSLAMDDSALPGDMRKFDKMIGEYDTARSAPVDVRRAQGRKDVYADAAARLYRTGKGPQKAQFQELLAKGNRDAVEARVPNIRAMNTETQTQLALRESLLTALDKESRSSRFTVSGLLDNPRLWGAVAHGARRTGAAATHSPQAARAALIALMSSHGEPE